MVNYSIGIVIIGRNEGNRLKRCLHSALAQDDKIVYVDSGSSDESVLYANSLGIDVLELDKRTPFSAGRARNEGYKYIVNKYPQLQLVQFIDGDCELCEGWLIDAFDYLQKHALSAIVAGRIKERFPEKSIYNLLCDLEWAAPVGEVEACGGIFMVRKDTFQEVGGFNPLVVAGEEPDFCYRLRKTGVKIYRLDRLMAFHDAGMTKFSQWWRRMIRSGYGALDVVTRIKQGSNSKDEIPFAKQIRSSRIWTWGWLAALVILSLTGIIFAGVLGLSLGLLAGVGLWIAQSLRTTRQPRAMGAPWPHAVLFGIFTMIGKWPQMIGQHQYLHKMKNKFRSEIIEYK